MSDQAWPSWARQDEAPIAVMDEYSTWRRPDGKSFATALYIDGTVLRHPISRPIECQTPEYVRQVIAFLDFPSSGYERFAWMMALEHANARRPATPTGDSA